MQKAKVTAISVIESLLSVIERADVREGCCCCGDNMENHSNPMDCGHSPIDAGEYYTGLAVEQAQQYLKAKREKQKLNRRSGTR